MDKESKLNEIIRLPFPYCLKQIAVTILAILLCFSFCESMARSQAGSSSEVYGPENLIKTLPTPFTTGNALEGQSESSFQLNTFAPIAMSAMKVSRERNLLMERFHSPKLFLPVRLVLGECSEFIVQGPPGSYAAIAMSEKNSGAKPIYGHEVRLGADRKLVAVNKIPESGIVSMFIEMPIQGDLVDSSEYFEAAVWSKLDFSDMQVASAVSNQKASSSDNGVLVCEQKGKKERMITLDTPKPMSMRTVGSLSSGRP